MPLSPNHPWNKETIPKPGKQSWKDRYSWDTAPTWDRMPMEAGAYTRMYMTAKAQKAPASRFLENTGTSMTIHVPKHFLPEKTLEWKIPEHWNAFERNRARAYCIPYSAMVAMENWLMAMDLNQKRRNKSRYPMKFLKKEHILDLVHGEPVEVSLPIILLLRMVLLIIIKLLLPLRLMRHQELLGVKWVLMKKLFLIRPFLKSSINLRIIRASTF